ncbi:hypothetical protein ACIF8T_22970 [Streptomyces sp. NPDC085946]|uniref:hypothetical protein n=1 Tax=Streptomyces sp. NPDC085946 TaxID=3365744 RepID=UPI0037D12A96
MIDDILHRVGPPPPRPWSSGSAPDRPGRVLGDAFGCRDDTGPFEADGGGGDG